MMPRSLLSWCALAVAVWCRPAAAQLTYDQVREVYASGNQAAYDQAAEDFLLRVESGEMDRSQAQMALVVPDSVRSLPPTRLAVWWRQQDPLPATQANERLVEHLARVATAERTFDTDDPVGFDVRGETFVRYGRPARRVSIDVESDLFIGRAIRAEPSIRRSDFPENEVWWYPSLDDGVYFMFVRKRGDYRLGGAMDLVPPALLAGGLTSTTQSRARLLGQVLRWIAKTLYPFSAEFRDRLVDIDAAVGGDGRAFSGTTGLVLQSEVQKARQSDERDQAALEQIVQAATQMSPPAFGVIAQAAAFRDSPDGTTSVWVGWGVDGDRLSATADSLSRLGLDPDQFLVVATTVTQDQAYRAVEQSDEQRPALARGPGLSPSWLVAEGRRGGAVAIQWSLLPTTADGTVLPVGPVSAQVTRVDLSRTDLDLVSDVVVLDAEAAAGLDEVDRLTTFAPPNPSGVVREGEQVAVYFEVYGAAGDVVEVETRSVRSRRGGLFRPGREQEGATASEIVLDDWRYPVVAVLDPGGLDEVDQLRVEVTVRNVETGAAVTRVVTLDRR